MTTSNTLVIGQSANATMRLTNNGFISVPTTTIGTGGSSSSPGALVVYSGTATFGNTTIGGTINGGSITVNGGNVSFGTLNDRRDASSGTATLTSGIIINGGSTTVSNLQLSTGNSGADLTVSNGSLTIGDPSAAGNFVVGSGTSGNRGGFVTVRGGTLTYLGTDGLLLNTTNSQGTAQFDGGTSTFAGITMNNPAALTSGNAIVGINGGTVYLGSLGLTANTAPSGPTATATVTLTSGVLGATADWSSSAPMTLAGNITIKAADAAAVPHNIAISGVLSGAGGLTKAGTGNLTLSGANTYASNTAVNAGTLILQQPSLSSNSTVSVASGAILQLNVIGTNQVAALVLNGVSQANGVYGSSTPGGYLAGTGYLRVQALGPSGPGSITNHLVGNQLSLTWPAGQGWRLQTTTNLAPPSWTYATDGSVNSTNITIDPAKPSVFYRLTFP
jgi:autotransporter-associated beta strand protein